MSLAKMGRAPSLVLAALLAAVEVQAQTPDYVEGELLVKFKAGAGRTAGQSTLHSADATTLKRFTRTGIDLVRVSGDTLEQAAELSRDPLIEFAEPNYRIYPDQADQIFPNDATFSLQWNLHNVGQTLGTNDADIDGPEAWNLGVGDPSIVIGVIDTGIDLDHPDLAGNLWVNPGEIPDNNIDDDANGYIDDVHGINAITGSGDPSDELDHGTHVAGIAAARGNNGVGIAGVVWNAQIMTCKFLGPFDGATDNAIECLEYMAAMGADVVNASWGQNIFSQALKDAIDSATASSDLLLVTSAGNDGTNTDLVPHYPASFDNDQIISVANTDHNDALWTTSNFGSISVDVAAPGADIFSTLNGGSYTFSTGTSMAAPHVTGLAALIWSRFPSLSALEVKNRILATVDRLGLPVHSGGRINAAAAVSLDPKLASVHPEIPLSGRSLTLSGIDFGAVQGQGQVDVVGASFTEPCAVTQWSDNEIVCTLPMIPTGDYGLVVTADSGLASAPFFVEIVETLYEQSVLPAQFLGGGVAQGWKADDRCWPLSLPTPFTFYGVEYFGVWVCSNGFLDFTGNSADFSNTTAELQRRTLVAPLWDDLRTDRGGDIYVHVPAADQLVIRWDATRYGSEQPVAVEVILDAADGSIVFNYGSGNVGLTPTVGISEGNEVRSLLGLHDGVAMLGQAASLRYLPSDPSPERGEVFNPQRYSVRIDWALVRDAGNPGFPGAISGFPGGIDPKQGSVAYDYRIGRTEVTNFQYVAFLNAVAKSDPNSLYNNNMATHPLGGIVRSGTPGSYHYVVRPGRGAWPVILVSFWDAIRFANWLQNGEPSGPQDATTTEDGAYSLPPPPQTPPFGDDPALINLKRNPGAKIFLPNLDEWLKAAFYDPTSQSWLDYATNSNSQPTCALPTSLPNSANCDSVVGGLTPVGSYAGAASPWGTFDQSGNVNEWTEEIALQNPEDEPAMAIRLSRGGGYNWAPNLLGRMGGGGFFVLARNQLTNLGFRVASRDRGPCSDGEDNDQDGLIDFPDDPGCRNESLQAIENPQCNDELDNDGDGKVDAEDSVCEATFPWWNDENSIVAGRCALGFEVTPVLALLLAWRRRSFRPH